MNTQIKFTVTNKYDYFNSAQFIVIPTFAIFFHKKWIGLTFAFLFFHFSIFIYLYITKSNN